MAVFDATALLLLLDPNVDVSLDPATNNHVLNARERVQYLVNSLEREKITIIIPTPALSEVLVKAGGAGPEYLEIINKHSCFRVVSFNQRAAVEHAALTQGAIRNGDKRDGSNDSWAKVKFDRQIVAIAKVEGAETIYSDDEGVHKHGTKHGLRVIPSWDLPLPPENQQRPLELGDHGDSKD